MPDQKPGEAQYPPTPEGDYRTAADAIRKDLENSLNPRDRMYVARHLADLAIRMTAAQRGAGLTAVAPPKEANEQEASQ